MDFKDILSQVERPYWSPMHPSQYIKRETRDGKLFTFGWGQVYPDDIGAFNLMWLMSGVGAPPDNYARYEANIKPIFDASFELVGGRYLKDLAALLPIGLFAAKLDDSLNPRIPQALFDALRLRV